MRNNSDDEEYLDFADGPPPFLQRDISASYENEQQYFADEEMGYQSGSEVEEGVSDTVGGCSEESYLSYVAEGDRKRKRNNYSEECDDGVEMETEEEERFSSVRRKTNHFPDYSSERY